MRAAAPRLGWRTECIGEQGFGIVPADKVATAVYAEQLRAVFRQMPIALTVNLVNAALTATVLSRIAVGPLPALWLLSVVFVTGGRWILWRRYHHRRPPQTERLWSLLAMCGSLLAGSCWGIGGVVLLPMVPVSGQIFLTFVIGGMCAGAVVLSASHLPTLLAFLLSASLPVAGRFLSEGTATDSALGAMIGVFALALSLAGARLNRIFTNAMRLRFELDEANLRLQAEMAEHRATEAALRQAQKLEVVGQLTGGIAHDFNNLLTVVIGNLVLASDRAGESSSLAPVLQNALQAAERGVALIQRLLAFARRQHLDPRSVDLGSLVAGIEELLHQTVGSAVRLEIAADPGLAPAFVDANQVELAILNLAINARDAMPAGGTLRIDLHNRRADETWPSELNPGDYSSSRSAIRAPAWTRRPSHRLSIHSSPRRRSAVAPAWGCRWFKASPCNRAGQCRSGAGAARARRSSSGCRKPPSRHPTLSSSAGSIWVSQSRRRSSCCVTMITRSGDSSVSF